MPNERTPKKPRQQYRLRTRLIHRSLAPGRWGYDQHVVRSQSSFATYRLSSVHHGAQGFVEFATPEARRAPMVPNQQKSAMQLAEFLQRQPKVQRVVYPRLANLAQRGLAHRQMTTPDGSLAPGHMAYFELNGKNGEVRSAAEAAERFVDYIAEKLHGHAGGEPGADQDAG